MELPFEYGPIVSGGMFVNRKDEKKRLALNLTGGLNTILISPRRWGKSSLVKQVSKEIENRKIRFCFIDLFHIRDEEDFYKVYDLLSQNTMLYQKEVDGLSNYQVNFLKALLDGVENFHASDILHKYKLGASSNVSKIKEALEKKEIIEIFTPVPELLDPVFGLWFKREFC